MSIQLNGGNSGKVVFLLAAGFEEGSAVYCLNRLREAGIAVSLVGVSAGLISGAHGLTVRPDCTLGQVTAIPSPKVVFIPDGKKSISALLSDPRVHRLMAATVEDNGVIAAMPEAAAVLGGEGKTAVSPIITQPNGNLDKFTDQLINLIIS